MYNWLAVLLLFLTNTISNAQTEVPLHIDDGGYITIPVKINDTVSAVFLLDTGGGVNMVSSDLFNKLDRPEQAGLHTGTRHNGEQITGMLYVLPSLTIGKFSKTNVVIGQYAGLTKYDGILSMSYFEDIPFSIDFIHRKLVIETNESLAAIDDHAEKIALHVKKAGKYQRDLFVNICINDSVHAKAEFDTGAGFNMLMLNTTYLKKLGINVPDKKQDYGYYVYSTTLSKLSYCGSGKLYETYHFVGFREGLIYEGLIGSGMFRNSIITINIPGKEILVWNK
ncbi:MAG: retropepsin-like aspartic protease [Bacteroidota bacterium]